MQDQTPRTLMRSLQSSSADDQKPPLRNMNAKDTIKGFIQASKYPSFETQHQQLINSPQLQRFNVYIEDQVIRFGTPGAKTGLESQLFSSPAVGNSSNDVLAFPPMYSATSAPPTGIVYHNQPKVPVTPQTPQSLANSSVPMPKIFTPVANNVPKNTPATPGFSASESKDDIVNSNIERSSSRDNSLSISEENIYKGISPSSQNTSLERFADDPSFDKLLSTPVQNDMHLEQMEKILQTPQSDQVNKSHASRSLFELTPTPAKASRDSISKSLIFSPDAKDDNKVLSTPARADLSAHTPQSGNLRPILIQGTPLTQRPNLEKQQSDREKNLEQLLSTEKSKNAKTPKYSPFSPGTPSKVRRDVNGRRLLNVSRVDSIRVKGSPQFAIIDYCLIFFNLVVFFAILIALAVLCQVMSAVHHNSFEDMLWWTLSQLTNVQLVEIFKAFQHKYFPEL